MSKTRVLVVDDSATMRNLIRMGLESDPRLEVVGEAASAREARDLVKTHSPDVITLDVEMPEINGLEFLRRLMRARPMPVVMFSSVTSKGSSAAVEALSLGAVECVLKPSIRSQTNTLKQLPDIVYAAAKAQVSGVPRLALGVNSEKFSNWNGKFVLIGASTGGVEALEYILSSMPSNCPPILITQHMPSQFLYKFADRLNRICKPLVRLAAEGDRPAAGEVLIAPGGETHLVLTRQDRLEIGLQRGPRHSGHRPSVDRMFLSAAPLAERAVAVILTGMGYDGAEGMAALRSGGAKCIAQDKESSVVYGMPKVAFERGGVEQVLQLKKIPAAILAACSL